MVMDEKERPTEQEYEQEAVAEGDMALFEDVPEPEREQRPVPRPQSSKQQEGENKGRPG